MDNVLKFTVIFQTEHKSKITAEFELFREEAKSEKSEWERLKVRIENQLNTFRDERVKLNADLSEARIRNEQVEELKRVIESEQRDKNDLNRQVTRINSCSKWDRQAALFSHFVP